MEFTGCVKLDVCLPLSVLINHKTVQTPTKQEALKDKNGS